MTPKVFISYSWSSPSHQERVKNWAEQLISDGVDVILDIYDLKEGNDKYAFMERMVTDPEVTHVLVISDKLYSDKANLRKAGVGTESQIISKETYDRLDQAKFIPIVCEFDESGEPCLPIFLRNRIWINFSTPEAVNENWEQLIRVLHGSPLHQKPQLGKPPAYISGGESVPASPVLSKYAALRQAILQEKPGADIYRQDFFDSCLEFAETLRVRKRPEVGNLGETVLSDFSKLKSVRNHIVDWVILEGTAAPSDKFTDSLLRFLENLRELKARPPELREWNDSWFEAHALFVYETFLYVVAALIKSGAFSALREVFRFQYIIPESERYGTDRFEAFDCFYSSSGAIGDVLSSGVEKRRYLSPAAELIKRNADRGDIKFKEIMQADLLALLMAFITPGTRWYPQTLLYAKANEDFPLFLWATRRRNFLNLAMITGIETADHLRELVIAGQERLQINKWNEFLFNRDFSRFLNISQLDTIQ